MIITKESPIAMSKPEESLAKRKVEHNGPSKPRSQLKRGNAVKGNLTELIYGAGAECHEEKRKCRQDQRSGSRLDYRNCDLSPISLIRPIFLANSATVKCTLLRYRQLGDLLTNRSKLDSLTPQQELNFVVQVD